MRNNPVGAYGRSNDTIAAPFLVMRCPDGGPLFASSLWPHHTGCLSEAIDIKYTREFLAGDTVGIRGMSSKSTRAKPILTAPIWETWCRGEANPYANTQQ